METGTEKMRAEAADGIGWLTFNNPARRNAMSLEMWRGLGTILQAFESDPAVRVVVMRGAGGKAFVSGADISEFDSARANAEQRESYAAETEEGRQWLDRLSKPLIALIDGFCIGGGLATAMSADIRFASPDSRFAIPAAKLGLGYEMGGLRLLSSLVGPARARDIMFSARMLEAEEALSIGLINFIVDRDDIEAQVAAYAALIAANAPLTVRAAKAALDQLQVDPADRRPEEISAMVAACFDSEDYAEGRRAFAEKRAPQFTGL